MRTLEITTKVGCPASCFCCPQEKLLAAYDGPEMMTTEMFASILEGTPTDVRIDFSGFCEPFANPNAVDFIIDAHNRGHSIAVFTTGLGLTIDDVQRLAQVPFDTFEIHTQDVYGISNIPQSPELDDVLKTIRNTLTNVITGDLGRVKIVSRAGNVKGMNTPNNHGPLLCQGKYPERFVVLPDGRAVLCCMDYSLRHVCGQINEVGYNALSSTRVYIDVRHWMVSGNALCRRCEMAVQQ